jgi:hypothetical protein
MLSSLFYHDVKRISEVSIFALFLSWCLSFQFLSRFKNGIACIGCLTLLILGIGAFKGTRLLNELDRVTETPMRSEVAILREQLLKVESKLKPGAWIVCHSERSQIFKCMSEFRLRYHWLTPGEECTLTMGMTPHCEKRLNKMTQIESEAAKDGSGQLRLEFENDTCLFQK